MVQRNPYLQDDLQGNPKRRKLLVEALQHRLAELGKRCTPDADRERDAIGVNCRKAHSRYSTTPTSFEEATSLRQQQSWAAQDHAEGQHQVRRPVTRLARHRRHRLAG